MGDEWEIRKYSLLLLKLSTQYFWKIAKTDYEFWKVDREKCLILFINTVHVTCYMLFYKIINKFKVRTLSLTKLQHEKIIFIIFHLSI